MSLSKLAIIIEKIHEQTISGKLEWEQTEKNGVFQVSFPNYSIRMSSHPSTESDDTQDYIISIYDSNGLLLESASDLELIEQIPGNGAAYRIMKEIYESAKGYALGVEQALDSIISELTPKDNLPF
jgi:hypothetical protein